MKCQGPRNSHDPVRVLVGEVHELEKRLVLQQRLEQPEQQHGSDLSEAGHVRVVGGWECRTLTTGGCSMSGTTDGQSVSTTKPLGRSPNLCSPQNSFRSAV